MSSNPHRIGVEHEIEEPQYSCIRGRYASTFTCLDSFPTESAVKLINELLDDAAAYVVAKYGAADPWRALPNGDLPEPVIIVQEEEDPLIVGPPYGAKEHLAVALVPHTQKQLKSIRIEIEKALHDGGLPKEWSPMWKYRRGAPKE